jgi:hypothetical protein
MIEKANINKGTQVLASLLNFKNELFTQEEIEAKREKELLRELDRMETHD